VDIGEAARIFQAARHPKNLVSLDRADHLLTDRSDAVCAGQVIVAWAGKPVGRLTRQPKTWLIKAEPQH